MHLFCVFYKSKTTKEQRNNRNKRFNLLLILQLGNKDFTRKKIPEIPRNPNSENLEKSFPTELNSILKKSKKNHEEKLKEELKSYEELKSPWGRDSG